MKRFIVGFALGGVVFGAFGSLATEYNIMENPFPIVVDGRKSDIKGFNINGSSYFNLRDIGEATGFKVDFVGETILINKESDNAVESKIDSANLPRETQSVDGIRSVLMDDGKYYVATIYVNRKYQYEGRETVEKGVLKMVWRDEILLDNIPYYDNDPDLIELTYYNEVMLPLILTRLYE